MLGHAFAGVRGTAEVRKQIGSLEGALGIRHAPCFGDVLQSVSGARQTSTCWPASFRAAQLLFVPESIWVRAVPQKEILQLAGRGGQDEQALAGTLGEQDMRKSFFSATFSFIQE